MPTFTYNASTGKLEKGGVSSDNAIDLRDGDTGANIVGDAEVVVTPGTDVEATATLNYAPSSENATLAISDDSGATESGNSGGKVVVETATNSTSTLWSSNIPFLM